MPLPETPLAREHSPKPASAEKTLYYLCVPAEVRPVSQPIGFLPVQEFLRDEDACKAVWDMAHNHFRTRGKFLAIWPSVRFVALCRQERDVGGFLLVSTPLNWQIDYVTVRPDMQHQGIAAALVNETLNQALARKAPYVMLTSNESLRSLYEGRCGFKVVASDKG